MTYSNPAGSSPAATTSYVRALLDLLGSRDPIEVLAELIPSIEERIRSVDERTLRRPERPGPESVAHIIRLMAAHDLVHRRQLDRILAAAHPVTR
jgi:hypothetical protein